MLNPFSLEKEALARVSAIEKHITQLRLQLSKKLLSEQTWISYPFQVQLLTYIESATPQPNKYSCKICKKKFNDGRKLGGHVSRAHKGEVGQGMKNQQSEEENSEFLPKKKTRTLLRRRVEKVLEKSELFKTEPIYEDSHSQ